MREVALRSRGKAAGGNAGGGGSDSPRYWAFLSYSHKDSAIADWLHGALEKYRVPRALVGKQTALGTIPSDLAPIFRDRHELAASGDLGHTIREALGGSRCLIVLCSPDAASSRWTNEEILAFKKMRPDGLVLAAITEGEPFASEFPGREAEECFPPALRQKYDSRGRPTGKRAEPIAADLRADKDGRQLGLLKIVAGMLGVGLDDLVQREQTRRHKRLTYIAAALLAGMTITSGLAVFAFDKRDEARDQRREAEGLVGFMLGDLREKLEPIGRLDALDAVGSRALEYFEKQDKSELSDAALAQRSKALTLMGEIAQTRGDLDGALRRYREAMAGTGEMVSRDPENGDRIFDHAQNVFWVGSIAYQRGLTAQAESAFREYKRLAGRLMAIDPNRKEWQLEPIYADTNLGMLLHKQLRFSEASGVFRNQLANVESLVAANPNDRALQDLLSETLAYLADARESAGSLVDALALRERQLSLMERIAQTTGADAPLRKKMVVANRALAKLFQFRGDVRQALVHFHQAASISDELLRTEPNNTEWARNGANVLIDLGELELANGEADRAGAHIRAACAIVDDLIRRDATVVEWQSRLRGDCLRTRARLALAIGAPGEARALASQYLQLARQEAAKRKSPDSRFTVTAAGLLMGDAEQAAGNSGAAKRSWQDALSAWPNGVEMAPRNRARRVVLLTRLGNSGETTAERSRLDAMGYRDPIFMRELRPTRG
jgi:eukaryotic-like serine/threonine-protein kinase